MTAWITSTAAVHAPAMTAPTQRLERKPTLLISRSTTFEAESRFSAYFCQAEDGIRALIVTGVQTCALPISGRVGIAPDGLGGHAREDADADAGAEDPESGETCADVLHVNLPPLPGACRPGQ